jgi:DNA repair protein SbcC/Rad50
MRPLRLRLKNFTAFRDEQEIDFANLDLFALWGPVGSGKSSILDAITYALFGRVERVGDEPKYLVSQGQPRMAVTFDFRVGDLEARIMRTTHATGTSKVLLERRVDGEWQTFGEGADQVRSVNKTIVDLVGLDYDAFTRSVVLPQGKFAQFLVGDPLTRRKILTELLGLELFEKMGKRSNEIANDARVAADVMEAMLDRNYSDVTEDKLADTRAAHATAAARAGKVQNIQRELSSIADDARVVDTAVERARAGARTISDLHSRFGGYVRSLNEGVLKLREEHEDIAAATIEVEKATDAVEGAQADFDKAQKRWGRRDELVALRERVARYVDATSEVAECETSLARSTEALEAAATRAAGAREAVREAQRNADATSSAVAEMKRRHEEAHRHDLVGTLVSGIEPGAPCPICERPLEYVPEIDDEALTRAGEALDRAELEHRRAEKAVAELDRAHAVALAGVESATVDRARCEGELQRRSEATKKLHDQISGAFPGPVPNDPAEEVDRRVAELEELEAALDEAKGRLESAEKALYERNEAAARARSEIDLVRVAIEQCSIDAAIADAVEAGVPAATIESLPHQVPDEPGDLERYARAAATILDDLGRRLDGRTAELWNQRYSLEQRAVSLLPEDARPATSIEAALESAAELLRRATDEAARAHANADKLAEELAAKTRLQADCVAQRRTHELYRALGMELRRDRIIDYLQAEALSALAHFAGERLLDLSGGRYGLAFENEGFYVVDGWNGEERRRVSTLSGGETFLASLALALALSEQVQLLAVTERQRLESLFLDEGFGSLDAETLEVVVAAIEQLGGEDRLVGVITHVTEVAERLPTRIEVVKSPRGSRLIPSS